MCIRDRLIAFHLSPDTVPQATDELPQDKRVVKKPYGLWNVCLLHTSDAADDLLCVDLGGRRIIKKKKK